MTIPDLLSLPEVSKTEAERPLALASVRTLVESLNANNIRYCHWKSNLRLEKGLMGRTDLDLLVDPADQDVLRSVLAEHQVKRVLAPDGKRYPGVEDYLGFDSATGKLFHLHVHYLLVLGEQFVKNYHIPLEEQFLSSVVCVGGWIHIPRPELELAILSMRALLKYRDRDAFKDMLSIRSPGLPGHIMDELNWLYAQTNPEELRRVLDEVSAILPVQTIRQFLDTIHKNPRDGFALWRLRAQVRAALKKHQRRGRLQATVQYFRELWRREVMPHFRSRQGMTLPERGLTITLIGADGAGKTTLTEALQKWLSWKMDVKRCYLGSKEASRLSDWLYLGFRIARKIQCGISKLIGERPWISRRLKSVRQLFLYLHLLSVGHDRYRQYLLGRERAASGSIVLFDRFPYKSPLDGPEIEIAAEGRSRKMIQFLSQREKSLYAKFTHPDLSIILDVSPQISIARKPDHPLEKIQAKKAAIEELQSEYESKWMQNWVKQNADLPYADVLLEIKRKIWMAL